MSEIDFFAIREAWAADAKTLVGFTAGTDGQFEALIDPADSAALQREYDHLSLCIPTRAGFEERNLPGVTPRGPVPHGQTIGGYNTTVLEKRAGGTIMHRGGALRAATLEAPPKVGDGIWWAASVAPGGEPEHVDTCVTSIVALPLGAGAGFGGGGFELEAVAGGQRTDQAQAGVPIGTETIKLVARQIRWTGTVWIDLASRRAIAGILDAELYSPDFYEAA